MTPPKVWKTCPSDSSTIIPIGLDGAETVTGRFASLSVRQLPGRFAATLDDPLYMDASLREWFAAWTFRYLRARFATAKQTNLQYRKQVAKRPER